MLSAEPQNEQLLAADLKVASKKTIEYRFWRWLLSTRQVQDKFTLSQQLTESAWGSFGATDLLEYSEPEDEGKKIFLIFHAKVLKIEYSFQWTWITGVWGLAAELEGVSLSP